MTRPLTLILSLTLTLHIASAQSTSPTDEANSHEDTWRGTIPQGGFHKHNLQSESPNFETINTGQGVAVCQSIIQDSIGYVWIATTNGILRYDGISLERFADDDVIDSTQMRNYALELAEDTYSNCIWASRDYKMELACIDKSTFQTHTITYSFNDTEVYPHPNTNRSIRGLVALSDSLLLCRTRLTFFTLNKHNGNVRVRKVLTADRNTPQMPFFNTAPGVFYTICESHLLKITSSGGGDTININPVALCDSSGQSLFVKNMTKVTDSTLCLTTYVNQNNLSVQEYNTRTNQLQWICDCPTNAAAHTIAMADDGVWIGTNMGLTFIRLKDAKRFDYKTSNSSLCENNIKCLLRLRNQAVFMIGSNDGLMILNYFKSRFEHTDMRRYSTSDATQVRSMAKDSQGNVWVGSIDGLYLRDANNRYLKKIDISFAVNKRNAAWVHHIDEVKGQQRMVVCLARCAMTYNLNGELEKIIFDRRNDMGEGKAIRQMQTLPNGEALFLMENEIVFINTATGKEQRRVKAPSNGVRFMNGHTDDYKTYWLACQDNMIRRLDLKSYTITDEEHYEHYKLGDEGFGRVNIIRHNTVNGVNELWMQTTNGNLLYKNPGMKGIKLLDGDLVPWRCVKSLEVDSEGNVWIGSHDRLYQVSGMHLREFTSDKYDICNRYLSMASGKGANGEIMVGGRNDFVIFTPGLFDENDYFPAPVVSSYVLANSVQKNYDEMAAHEILYNGDNIEIPAGIRSIILNVRSLDYDRPEDNKIQWRMEGDKDWRNVSPNWQINLTHITEGNHTVMLRTLDDDGFARGERTIVALHKSVFFYEKTMFRYFLIVAAVATAILIVIINNRRSMRIRKKLTAEMSAMSNMLVVANQEMRLNQATIRQQNEELAQANQNLERTVAERTSELEKAKEKAEESSQLKSAFLASLGHEVRTPMNAIVGFAKLLQTDDCSPEERSEFAHLILESSNSLLSLMGALLDTSRIERGVMEVTLADTDVWREINDTWRMLSVEKKNKDVEFKLDIDENLRDQVLVTDKDRLRQIIINLTYNAFKFTNTGSVTLRAQREDISILPSLGLPEGRVVPPDYHNILLVSVKDTGIGIPADKTEAIFEPFLRLNTNKARYAGLGLGLNIVKSLTQMLGGDVWVVSHVGIGSTFYFYLPFGLKKDK